MRRVGIIRRGLGPAVRFTAALGVAAAAPQTARAVDAQFSAARVEVSYTSDNNVTRASGADALPDRILGVRASKGFLLPVSTRTRAVFQGFAGGEKFHTYTGLSHNFIGAQGDFQFRSSAEFGAATYAAFLRSTAEYYESDLRDGYRHVYGLSVLKPMTDRVQFFGALARNISDGKSAVFDTRGTSLRGNLDWSLGRWDTVYLGAELRRGDTVSTAPLTPGRADLADAVTVIPDDAYNNPALFAYRFKASTRVTTLGYNRAFSGGHSLDFSWRWIRSTPLELRGLATASENSYTANQFSVAYLARF
jgi:hypothetical protein